MTTLKYTNLSCTLYIYIYIYIYIYNYFEDYISTKVLDFAEDAQVFITVQNDSDKQSLHDDSDKIVKYSENWQMFNFGTYKCIHIGRLNMDEECKTGDSILGRITKKDLGVTYNADIKISEECVIAASRGNQMISLLRRTIRNS